MSRYYQVPLRRTWIQSEWVWRVCGAISGFHALVASGTTPKMINRESDARMIGYGAMLMEGVVGIIALIAACSLKMGDYFAINLSPEKFAAVAPVHGFSVVNLAELSREGGRKRRRQDRGGPYRSPWGLHRYLSPCPG